MSPEAWRSEIERCIKELGFVGIKLRTVGHALFPASKDGMTELVKAKEDEISEDKLERYYRKTTENLFNIAILCQRLDEQDLRLVTYSVSGRSRVGAVINNLVVDLNLSYSAFLESKGEPFPETKADLELPPKMKSLIAKGMEGLERAKEAILFAQQREFRITDAVFSLPDVKFKAPVTDPSKIVCTGLNYEDYRIKLGLSYGPDSHPARIRSHFP
jgi:hypothetical protein